MCPVRSAAKQDRRTAASPWLRVCPPKRRWSIRPSGVRLNGSPKCSRSRTASIASLHMISAASWSTRKSPPLTVSKVCHSQLSSSTLARAAHMPPWAAPVWDRVGYSLVRTAVRTRVEDSSAARMPAPPAPTMTTSYWCVCMVFRTFPVSLRLALRQRRGGVDARVEREDDEGAQHEGEHGAEGQQRLQDEAGGVPLAVVVDDRPDAVDAVELREPEHHQVPGLPER